MQDLYTLKEWLRLYFKENILNLLNKIGYYNDEDLKVKIDKIVHDVFDEAKNNQQKSVMKRYFKQCF